MATVE
jgi:hypothetical protein